MTSQVAPRVGAADHQPPPPRITQQVSTTNVIPPPPPPSLAETLANQTRAPAPSIGSLPPPPPAGGSGRFAPAPPRTAPPAAGGSGRFEAVPPSTPPPGRQAPTPPSAAGIAVTPPPSSRAQAPSSEPSKSRKLPAPGHTRGSSEGGLPGRPATGLLSPGFKLPSPAASGSIRNRLPSPSVGGRGRLPGPTSPKGLPHASTMPLPSGHSRTKSASMAVHRSSTNAVSGADVHTNARNSATKEKSRRRTFFGGSKKKRSSSKESKSPPTSPTRTQSPLRQKRASFVKEIDTAAKDRNVVAKMLSHFLQGRKDFSQASKFIKKPHHFGVPLERSRSFGTVEGTPAFVHRCFAYVEENGLDLTGLFRVSGDKGLQLQLKQQFNYGDAVELEGLDPHAVIGVLKIWFRELRPPLFPFEFYQPMCTMWRSNKQQEILAKFEELPKSNRYAIEHFLRFAVKVCAHSEANKMNPKNVAIVMAPNLMRAEHETFESIAKDAPVTVKIVEYIIENAIRNPIPLPPPDVDIAIVEEDDPTSADGETVLHAGWLDKRAPSGLLRPWKKRWFAVYKGGHHVYYQDNPDSKKALGSIDLKHVKSIEPSSKNKEFGFNVIVEGGSLGQKREKRKFTLAAEDASTRDEWIRQLKEALALTRATA